MTPGARRRDARSYAIGLGLSLLMTALPFAIVAYGWLPTAGTLWTVGVSALAQVVVQFRHFLHVDLSRQAREDLQLILFTALILLIMVCGTVWVLASQMAEMGHV